MASICCSVNQSILIDPRTGHVSRVQLMGWVPSVSPRLGTTLACLADILWQISQSSPLGGGYTKSNPPKAIPSSGYTAIVDKLLDASTTTLFSITPTIGWATTGPVVLHSLVPPKQTHAHKWSVLTQAVEFNANTDAESPRILDDVNGTARAGFAMLLARPHSLRPEAARGDDTLRNEWGWMWRGGHASPGRNLSDVIKARKLDVSVGVRGKGLIQWPDTRQLHHVPIMARPQHPVSLYNRVLTAGA
ncbi:hypothetical protein BD779DRAFT_1475060 [Infundibulicybe gibba]|nr:hypothetical protein BD779DRAFT_1475060 [Infundibulicybe gibba]